MQVWLRNWTNGHLIASSNPGLEYSYAKSDFSKPFQDIFTNWRLYVSVNESLLASSTQHIFTITLIILSAAFLLLAGSLFFTYKTLSREEELIQRQADFLANVTHELKTPISVMQAAGENLADGRVKSPSRLKSYGGHIYNEALRLGNMINNLLNVAKADSHQLDIEQDPIYLNEVIHKYLKENRTYITETKNFRLKTSIPDNLPQIMGDKRSVTVIMENLVSNSIKYSDQQKFIGIYLFRLESKVILEVEDHGIGLTKSEKAHIFERFYRAESPMIVKTEGHGLGLPLVKKLAHLNGGKIQVKSKKGKGSTFTLSFPIIRDT